MASPDSGDRAVRTLLSAVLMGLAATAPLAAAAELPPLEHRIGRMLVVGFRGLEAGPEAAITELIRRHHVGGVILFDRDVPTGADTRNITSPRQLRRLTLQLQQAAAYPLLIAVDQEGGRVNRLKPRHGFRIEPAAELLGGRPVRATRRAAAATAHQLAVLGVNWNLVPVVDLAINPDNSVIAGLQRTFGARSARVAPRAAAVIRAHRRAGLRTALKHFPGHGSATGDTHKGVVDITDSWQPRELRPYRMLIDRGLADSVMVGHLRHRGLDPDWPASLSPAMVAGMLREDLGFDGVVVSDDLQMRAIRDRFGLRTVIRQALRAEVDLLMFANNTVYEPDIARRAADIIRDLVASGQISEARINRSFRRIREFTRGLGEGQP
jgi:beta-N-acetylhexosaminidase